MSIAGHGYGDFGGPFPAIVERARLDKEWQEALTRFGYRRVKLAYARQMRKSPKDEIFYGVEHLNNWPTMEFVRAWLKAEKKRMMVNSSKIITPSLTMYLPSSLLSLPMVPSGFKN